MLVSTSCTRCKTGPLYSLRPSSDWRTPSLSKETLSTIPKPDFNTFKSDKMPSRHNGPHRGTYYDADPPRSSRRPRQDSYPVRNDRFRDAKDPVKARAPPPRRDRVAQNYDGELSRRRHTNPREDSSYRGSNARRDQDSHRARARPPYRQERAHDERRRDDWNSPKGHSQNDHRFTQVATAAVVSGLTEAVRARHRPDRSSQAVKAAVGAAAMNALVGNNKNRRGGQGLTKSAVGGMLMNRLIRR